MNPNVRKIVIVEDERRTSSSSDVKCEMRNLGNDVVVHVFYRVIKMYRGLCVDMVRIQYTVGTRAVV